MRKKTGAGKTVQAVQLRSQELQPFGQLKRFVPLGDNETQVYAAMREAVPIIDAAIGKLVRLTGGFTAACQDTQAERELRRFLLRVNVGRGQYGIDSFLSAYLQSLLTYGRAIGEMVVSTDKVFPIGDSVTLSLMENKIILIDQP